MDSLTYIVVAVCVSYFLAVDGIPGINGCPVTVTPFSIGGSCVLCPSGPRGDPGPSGPPGRDGRDALGKEGMGKEVLWRESIAEVKLNFLQHLILELKLRRIFSFH